jgi:putative nucleotidyltransferase with HDIG domain
VNRKGPGLDLDRFRKPAGGSKVMPPRPAPPSGSSSGSSSAVPVLVRREQRTREILAGIESLPSLPTVVLEVLRLANDRSAGAADFEELVRRDQALAAKVLKLVNSPFFGLRTKVTSITQAVVVLGLKTLKSVVLAARTGKLLQHEIPQYGFSAGGMWRHSVSAASLARSLAKKAGLDADAREELFVAGLLHDVGKVVLAPHLTSLQDELAEALTACGGDLCRAEEDLLGISHAAVGGRMAAKWSLDPQLRTLIEEHHESGPPSSPGLRVLQLADDLCHQLGVGRAAGDRPPHPDFGTWVTDVGLDSASALREDAAARLAELEPVLAQLTGD